MANPVGRPPLRKIASFDFKTSSSTGIGAVDDLERVPFIIFPPSTTNATTDAKYGATTLGQASDHAIDVDLNKSLVVPLKRRPSLQQVREGVDPGRGGSEAQKSPDIKMGGGGFAMLGDIVR